RQGTVFAAMDHRIALIVNPHAGGGRAAEVLPMVEAALQRLGLTFHTERTESLEHAEALARAAAAAGEVAAALSGDGLIGSLAGALRALAAWRPSRFELSLDGRGLAFSGYSVAVANSPRYGGGMYMAPDAELDDGAFDVVMSGDTPKARALLDLPKLFQGSHVDLPYVPLVSAKTVRTGH